MILKYIHIILLNARYKKGFIFKNVEGILQDMHFMRKAFLRCPTQLLQNCLKTYLHFPKNI